MELVAQESIPRGDLIPAKELILFEELIPIEESILVSESIPGEIWLNNKAPYYNFWAQFGKFSAKLLSIMPDIQLRSTILI